MFAYVLASHKDPSLNRGVFIYDDLKKQNIDYKIIYGVDGSKISHTEMRNLKMGCKLGHIECMIDALKQEGDHFLFFESDVKILDSIKDVVNKCNLPEDYDCLYLGGRPLEYKPYNDKLNKVINAWGGYGLLMSRKGIEKRLDLSFKHYKVNDELLGHVLTKENNCYVLKKLIIKHCEGNSILANRYRYEGEFGSMEEVKTCVGFVTVENYINSPELNDLKSYYNLEIVDSGFFISTAKKEYKLKYNNEEYDSITVNSEDLNNVKLFMYEDRYN